MRSAFPLLLLLALGWGCAVPPRAGPTVESVRLSELTSEGDPARRASLRLCTDGLRSDIALHDASARSQYERAIAIDPTNAWAYLALSRHELAKGDPERALQNVQQAETLLRNEGAWSPGVEPHILGLRGAALIATGRPGSEYLRRAAALSPSIWSDGRLSAEELL